MRIAIPRFSIPRTIRPLRILLIIALLEIFLGGGGRLIDTGAFSIRMYLFVVTLFFGAIMVFGKNYLHQSLVRLALIYTLLLALGIVIGVITGQTFSTILIDVKPLLFFYYLFFFAAMVRREEDVDLVIRLFRICAVILALAYLFVLALIHTQTIAFTPFYIWASYTEEFYFRGEFAFFYKGFIFLCAGVFFYRWNDGFRSKLAIILILGAVMLTFTRGFVLSLFILYVIKLAVIDKQWLKLAALTILSVFFAAAVWGIVVSSGSLQASRTSSDKTRVAQFKEVISDVNPITLITGRGFGDIHLQSRDTQHLEITYAEIFLKQGILGLCFWFYIAWLIYTYYNMAVRRGYGQKAKPFLLASTFTYILSVTNPYIINPMGITALMLSLISLYTLADAKRGLNA